MNAPGSGNATRPQGCREEEFFRKVFRKIARHSVHVHIFDIYERAASYRLPGVPQPYPFDIAVNQEMEVRVPAFLKFENPDIRGRNSKPSFQICSKLGEYRVQIPDRIAFDLRRVKRQSDETTKPLPFGDFPYCALVSFRFLWSAIGTIPAFAIDTTKNRARRFHVLAAHGEASAMLSASARVSINL